MYTGADVEKTQAPVDVDRENYKAEHQAFKQNRCDSPMQNAVCSKRPMTSEEIIAEFFKYHAPNETTIPKYAAINQAAKNFAEVILANCPPGADRSAAIRLIRDARMTANASVALNGLSLY
jgi:hypothetical protein